MGAKCSSCTPEKWARLERFLEAHVAYTYRNGAAYGAYSYIEPCAGPGIYTEEHKEEVVHGQNGSPIIAGHVLARAGAPMRLFLNDRRDDTYDRLQWALNEWGFTAATWNLEAAAFLDQLCSAEHVNAHYSANTRPRGLLFADFMQMDEFRYLNSFMSCPGYARVDVLVNVSAVATLRCKKHYAKTPVAYLLEAASRREFAYVWSPFIGQCKFTFILFTNSRAVGKLVPECVPMYSAVGKQIANELVYTKAEREDGFSVYNARRVFVNRGGAS